MKKLITVISLISVLAVTGTATIIKSKADIKTEKTEFAVSSDRSIRPSAYCRYTDGSPVGNELSTSDNFCISGMAGGNMSLLSYDGRPAYCIGLHTQNAPTSLMQVTKLSDIPYDSEEYGAVFRIAAAGASTGTTEFGLSDTDLYYVTQCAVRCFLYNTGADNLAFFDENGNINNEMTNEFRRISEAAYSSYIPFDTELTIDDSQASEEKIFSGDKCYFRYGPFYTYSEYTDIEYYTLSGFEGNDSVIISSFEEITDYTSEFTYESSAPFYVYIDSVYEEELNININSDTHVTRYSPTVYLSGNDGYQNIFQLNITDSDESLSGNLTLKNTDTTGDLKLNKKFLADNTEIIDHNLILQPRFVIINEQGKYVSGIQSDGQIVFDHFSDEPIEYSLTENSEIYVSGLPVGEYRIIEEQGAEGYTAQESELSLTNTNELNFCEFVNVSIVTTTETTVITTTTFTETTSSMSETTTVTSGTTAITTGSTVQETTALSDFTLTLPSETPLRTDISEEYETESVTTDSTIPETEFTTLNTVKTPAISVRKTPGSPKTGDSKFPLASLISLMAVSAVSLIIFRNK